MINHSLTEALLPVQVRYLVDRCVDAADVALVVPAAMSAALQLAVVVTVTAASVQEELVDAPVLYLLTVWETNHLYISHSQTALNHEMQSGNYSLTTTPSSRE